MRILYLEQIYHPKIYLGHLFYYTLISTEGSLNVATNSVSFINEILIIFIISYC